LPWGLDRRERLKPREVKRVSVGLVSLAGEASGSASTQFLTADRNLVSVRATVQYSISDPARYVRQRAVADVLVAQAGEAGLARALASQPVDPLLTHGRTEVAVRVLAELQSTLDGYGLGISVRSVDIGSLEPPGEVAAAFADVVAAQREREQAINQAHSYASQTIADARAMAQRTVDAARGDSERRVREATGEAARFDQLLAEYQRSPALTARRIYWETISDVLSRLRSKLLIDRGQQLDLSVFGASPGPQPTEPQNP
jgi:membrane protease subunit HflK